MDSLLSILYTLLSPLRPIFGPLSNSNLLIIVLGGMIILFTALMLATPLIVDRLGLAAPDQTSLLDRFMRQLRRLRGNDELKMTERIKREMHRDGQLDSQIEISGDFFWFIRILFAVSFGLVVCIAALAIGQPGLLLLALGGYFMPGYFAKRANKKRLKLINDAIPAALRRLETRIAAGTELREALLRVSAKREGPLYSELTWATAQMNIPGNEPFTVLRRLDERNGLTFFTPLADQLERASRRGRKDTIDAFLAYVEKVLDEDENKRQAKIAGLANKVLFGMVPFLVIALLIALIGPFVVSGIGTPGGAP